jgi:hypothetical protein
MKICPVGAELLHADRKTGMGKIIVAFRNFSNASIMKKKSQFGKLKMIFKKTVLVLRCYSLVPLYNLLPTVKAFACRQWTVFMQQH